MSSNYSAVSKCERWGNVYRAGCLWPAYCPQFLRLNSDFAFATSVPCSGLRKCTWVCIPSHAHTHTHTRTRTTFASSKLLGGGGCSHNIVSLLAFFWSSKSGSMFVDAEGGMEVCVCVCVMNGTHHRPPLVIPSVFIWMNYFFDLRELSWILFPLYVFLFFLLTVSPHLSLSLSLSLCQLTALIRCWALKLRGWNREKPTHSLRLHSISTEY